MQSLYNNFIATHAQALFPVAYSSSMERLRVLTPTEPQIFLSWNFVDGNLSAYNKNGKHIAIDLMGKFYTCKLRID